MKTICVLGNNSGRNAGDMAILGNLLNDISAVRGDVRFLVPTTNPALLQRRFGSFRISPIPLMPWYGAIKNFGLPLMISMIKADMVLISDNILFDRKFYNPVFNNLSSISLFTPLCRKRGIPLVCYNASIGPIDYPVGVKALKRVMEACPLVITRDQQTEKLLQQLKIPYPRLVVHADCALNTISPPKRRLDQIIRKEGLFGNPKGTIGFNVNAYIDNWSMKGVHNRESFSRVIAGAVDRLIEKLDVDVLFTVTQVMDLSITEACINQLHNHNRVRIISNIDYTYEEITGLLQKVEVHAGLRTHTLIFCAAVNTPMICIKSYPKSTGFMSTIKQDEWVIGFEDLTIDNLSDIVLKAWKVREKLREDLKPIVAEEKRKAKASAELVSDLLKD